MLLLTSEGVVSLPGLLIASNCLAIVGVATKAARLLQLSWQFWVSFNAHVHADWRDPVWEGPVGHACSRAI